MRVRYLNANHARQACKNLNFDVRCSLIRKSHGLDKLKPGAPLFSSLFATSHSAQRDQCSKLIMPPSFKAAALVTAPIFKRAHRPFRSRWSRRTWSRLPSKVCASQRLWSLRSLFLTSPSPTQEERNQALFEDAEKGDLRSVDALLRGGERKSFEAANLEAYKQQMAEMEESFGALVSQLPSDTEVPGLLEDITNDNLASAQRQLQQPTNQPLDCDTDPKLPTSL